MTGSRAPRSRRARVTTGLFCACALAGAPARAAAQVIEVGADGSQAVYERPTVFNASGAVPIDVRSKPVRSSAPVGSTPQALAAAADAFALSPELVEAVAWRESRLQPRRISRAGAIGEMQLMPGTARDLGVDPFDTVQNYRGGSDYLRRLLQRYDGDLVRTLAAYNAGPGAVDRYKGVPPYKETKAYVAAIMDRLSGRVSLGEDEKPIR